MNCQMDVSAALSDGQRGQILLIDNYDSFTYNIRECLAKIGVDVTVVRNNEITMEEVEAMNPSHIILGPGPGSPECPEDIGITNEIIDYAIRERKALLGVCLGHQAIAHRLGARIVPSGEMLHGKTSRLIFSDLSQDEKSRSLFTGVDHNAPVMRYHSLAVDPSTLPDALRITACTRDDFQTIMAFQHTKLPVAGVQFHPESFATPEGARILENFLRFNPRAFVALKQKGIPSLDAARTLSPLPVRLLERIRQENVRACQVLEFPCSLPPETVYARLHAASSYMCCFESLGENGGRFSYFGADPRFVLSGCNERFYLDDEEISVDAGAYDVLTAAVEAMRGKAMPSENVPQGQIFSGGFAGYLAFEGVQYAEPTALLPDGLTPEGERTFAFGYFPDCLVYDQERHTYHYCTRDDDRRVHYKTLLETELAEASSPVIVPEDDGVTQAEFEGQVQAIQKHLRRGDTFQTVLSRRKHYRMRSGSMAPLYQHMRNIAPSANMHAVKIGDHESIGSFPELTLRIEDGVATTYQIAGTRLRSGNEEEDVRTFAGLLADPKEVAEHSMLIDLAYNDLGHCSIPGTVHIPENGLMHRLDAGAVLHLASEIRSRVNGIPPLTALLRIAPMGTVSGAPKVRSMQFIHQFELQRRGLYAGSFGFVDLNGNAEFVVGLRSIGRQGDRLTVQAGAGIVLDSCPKAEFAETESKMAAAIAVVQRFRPLCNATSSPSTPSSDGLSEAR